MGRGTGALPAREERRVESRNVIGALICGLVVVGCTAHERARPAPAASKARPTARLAGNVPALPFGFEPNVGQTDPRVRFLARGNGFTLFLTDTEAVVRLPSSHERPPDGAQIGNDPRDSVTGGGSRLGTVLRIQFIGANPAAPVAGRAPQPGKVHVYRGRQPDGWRTNIPRYGEVVYEDLYPGIDLVFRPGRTRSGAFEYDFIVSPGAGPERIALAFRAGAETGETGAPMRLDAAGHLVVPSAAGEIIQAPPVVYQETASGRRERGGSYVLRAAHAVGFHVGPYDHSAPLVIDPVVNYATYLGGSRNDEGVGIAVDAAGSAYVTGVTESADFPTEEPITSGPSALPDAFVAKLTPEGNALVYATYLGGSDRDFGKAVAVGAAGDAFVAGWTSSTDFPVTAGGFQTTGGRGTTSFVARLDPGGSLVYSTYLGGSGLEDTAHDVAVDGAANTYVVGTTDSEDFPVTSGLQTTYGGGESDAFISVLNATGAELLYSSFLGGSDGDRGGAIALDPTGGILVAGTTKSDDFPVQGALQPMRAGRADVFLARLDPRANELIFSTYLGGSGSERATGVALDDSGSVYIAGGTSSPDFPTVRAVQPNYGGLVDAYVAKLTPDGQEIIYATYLGGRVGDSASGLAVDREGNAYVAGQTAFFAGFPVVRPVQPAPGGYSDCFVAQLGPTGKLRFSTHLGGSDNDLCHDLAMDASGNVYVTGFTNSFDFPLLNPIPGQPWQRSAFVAKLGFGRTEPCAFVTDGGAGSVLIVDVAVRELVESLQVAGPGELLNIALSPDGSRLYVSNAGVVFFPLSPAEVGGDLPGNEAVVIDTASKAVVARIPVHGQGVSPSARTARGHT